MFGILNWLTDSGLGRDVKIRKVAISCEDVVCHQFVRFNSSFRKLAVKVIILAGLASKQCLLHAPEQGSPALD